MMRCVRILMLYSLRFTKKHTSLLVIASVLVLLPMLLQLYVYRRYEPQKPLPQVGDFNYKPGVFLKGRQPNENISYCDFNYGLPDKLNWNSVNMYPSPEIGKQSPYKVIYNAITGTKYANHSKFEAVTYATQATPEFIYHVVEIARYWEGPISLAVFVPGYDLDVAMQIMVQLCHCYPGMSKVSLHLFFPKLFVPKLRTLEEKKKSMVSDAPSTIPSDAAMDRILRKKLENYRNLNNVTRAKYVQWVRQNKAQRMVMNLPKLLYITPNLKFADCSGLESNDYKTYRNTLSMVYPINVGRNVARIAAKTNYFIVSDIEMVPSDFLASRFRRMMKKLMKRHDYDENRIFNKTIFVVPVFEVARGETIPRDKETLVRLVEAKRAMYFHQKVCVHCQRFPGMQTWLGRPMRDVLEPILIAKREYPYHRWEPLYFGTNLDPLYSEILSWEGRQDKMTQMVEMCLQGYRMMILDGGFLCHAAAYRSGKHRWRDETKNSQKYTRIVRQLRRKYGNNKVCKMQA